MAKMALLRIFPRMCTWVPREASDNERVDFPITGAYGMAVMEINRDGRLDLIFPFAWIDKPASPGTRRRPTWNQISDHSPRLHRDGLKKLAARAR